MRELLQRAARKECLARLALMFPKRQVVKRLQTRHHVDPSLLNLTAVVRLHADLINWFSPTTALGGYILTGCCFSDRVFEVKSLETNKILVAKQCNESEILIARQLLQANVAHCVTFLDQVQFNGQTFMFMERARETCESYCLKSNAEVHLLYEQVSAALHEMHNQNIVHCDLGLPNIFVFASANGTTVRFKVGDYSLSDSCLKIQTATSVMSRWNYAAPEALIDQPTLWRHWLDWWSFGCVLFQMLARQKTALFSYDREASEYDCEENENDVDIVRSLLFQMHLILGPYPFDEMAQHFRNRFFFDMQGNLRLPVNKSKLEQAVRKMKGYAQIGRRFMYHENATFLKICKNLFNKKLLKDDWYKWAFVIKKMLTYEPTNRV